MEIARTSRVSGFVRGKSSAVWLALLPLWFISLSRASDDGAAAVGRPQVAATDRAAGSYVWKARSRPADTTATTPASSEVFPHVVIAAGKNVMIQSSLDYSSSSTVAVAVLCSTCTATATSLGTLGLILEARWQPLSAEFDTATDMKSASTFSYWDAGGAVFNVYAEQFNLELRNTGTATITLDQVTIFRRAQ